MRLLVAPLAVLILSTSSKAQPLPGTKPLEMQGDLARFMVDGLHRYLTAETAAGVAKRKDYWKPDYSSPEAYAKSVEPNRERLRKIIGAVDQRLPVKELEYVADT